MIVRPATSDDYQALMPLYGDFLETGRFAKPDNDSFQAVLDGDNTFLLVAEDGGRLAGMISASIRPVVRYPKPIMQIDELYVDPGFRGQGVGRQLIEGAEAIGVQKGCRRSYVESGYQHEPAHKFYERNGYGKRGYYFSKLL